LEPTADELALRITASTASELVGDEVPFHGEASGAVTSYRHAEPLFAPLAAAHPSLSPRLVAKSGARSVLFHPVVRDGSPIAVLCLVWRELEPYLSERRASLVELLANEAANAIERATLMARLAELARTDDLTGLPNRRSWDEALDRELLRAERSQTPLTLAMVDLDNFKDFNDLLGHQAGDRLLKYAASSWQAELRATDVIARYGGEEFALALPACPIDAAIELAERLREATPNGQTCSIGLAQWNEAESAESLLSRADMALYKAKAAGKDRVVVANPFGALRDSA
jgi:diguanylate cyclase (GGDEF)-like protein